jgi:hypothetical protein
MASCPNHKPRELRRRLMLRARMRAGCGWSDACIVNVSSRGLQINANRAAVQGGTVEIWHGEHVIVARVVWRKGTRAGLQAEQRVPVEELMTLGQAPRLQLTAAGWPEVERRKRPRTHDDSRLRARAIEFAGLGLVAATLALGASAMVEQAFARPLTYVEAALRG